MPVVAAALCWSAPAASADVSFLRSWSVSNVAFALDGAGTVYVARDGGVDSYSSAGAPGPSFAVPANFNQVNDMVFADGKLYAVSGSSNRLHAFNPDGSGHQESPSTTDNQVNLARAVAVAGTKVYVGTGETRKVARLTTTPTFGDFELSFGWKLDGATESFQTCVSSCNAGPGGPEPGKINDARGLAVDGGGNIYVVEQGWDGAGADARIEVFSSAPAPVRVIGSAGSGAGQLKQPIGVDLDAAGNLWVADQRNHRIDQFKTDGTFVQAFGFGVKTGAAALETCTTTCQAGIAGTANGQLNFPLQVAFFNGEIYVADLVPGAPRISVFGVGTPSGGGGGGAGGGGGPAADAPSADIALAKKPTCLSIPSVTRDQRATAPGGGKLVLQTRQVNDPARPLRMAVRGSGGARISSVAFKVNGRSVSATSTTAGAVPVTYVRVGSRAKRNKLTATVTLANGKKVTLTQFAIVLKCHTPRVACQRLAGNLTMRCTSSTPLGGRRVRITASRTTREVATGSATVKKGKYTATVRSKVALSAGTYAYKHVVTTSKPRQRYFMIRTVRVG